jgi:hypothetical protein
MSKMVGYANVFFLPLATRPKALPPINIPGIKRFWHTGIVYENKVYETFNFGRWSKSPFSKRSRELKKQGAVWVGEIQIGKGKLESELTSGTSCGQYVFRVVGLSKLEGPNKGDRYPDDVYECLVKGLGK